MTEAFNLRTREHRFAAQPVEFNRYGETTRKASAACAVCGKTRRHSIHIKITTNRGRGNRVGDAHLSGR